MFYNWPFCLPTLVLQVVYIVKNLSIYMIIHLIFGSILTLYPSNCDLIFSNIISSLFFITHYLKLSILLINIFNRTPMESSHSVVSTLCLFIPVTWYLLFVIVSSYSKYLKKKSAKVHLHQKLNHFWEIKLEHSIKTMIYSYW